MSNETSVWLNTMTRIGFTEKRGHAWHYRAEDQGEVSNHFAGAVPVEVVRDLFDFPVVDLPVLVNFPCGIDEATGVDASGNPVRTVALDDRKAIGRTDTGDVFGIFKSGYQFHSYTEWLVGNVANILRTNELEIGSAGLLRKGAQAWVQVEMPENVHDEATGFAFRPHLLACTSGDGSLATTYKRMVTAVVCDNTLAAGLSESGQVYKVKHSKHSHLKLDDAAEALSIVGEIADEFTAELARLSNWEVTDSMWDRFLEAYVPIDADNKRSVTVGDAKREQLNALYRWDERAATWNGTALGVLQATNTYAHHYAATRGDTIRGERNMSDALTGKTAERDSEALRILASV